MKTSLTVVIALAVSLLAPLRTEAHCDAVDGPVAVAARKALDTRNVNLVLPYAPAEFEAELTAAFDQALVVRDKGPEAKTLANRYFIETAVRLHRSGEKAPYTGLKPAGTDFGPAIPAAEKAIETGTHDALVKLLSEELSHGIAGRLQHALGKRAATKEPATKADVAAARERVRAELEFIGYVEGIYVAITGGGGHAE
jgi:uncharacterized protein DUF6448